MKQIPITAYGVARLREELQRLKSVDRAQVITAIAEARAHGDLKENAEYHAAKEQQGFIEARIRHLENMLSHAHIIDITQLPNTGKVIFGVTVTVITGENDLEVTYQIVGDEESDIKNGKLSISAPIARALIGKEVGDIITAQTPSGPIEYEIVRIEHI